MKEFLSARVLAVSSVIGISIAATGAFDGEGTASQGLPTEPTAMSADMEPEVDYLMAEYGLDEAVAVEQVEFADTLEEQVPEIDKLLGESFGGAWIDNSKPGIFFVATTQPSTALDVLNELGISAVVHSVTYDETQLANGSAQLRTLLAEGFPAAPEDDSGFHIAVDIQANELDLELAPYYPITPELNEAIANFSPNVDLHSWEPLVEDDCPDRGDCVPDLRGGITVKGQDPPFDGCTLGFTMKDDDSGTRYVSTASHCAGSPWEHHNNNIGPTVWTVDANSVDGKIIDMSSRVFWDAKAWVFRPGNHAVHIDSQITDPGASLEGNPLCVEGRNGQKCGELVDYNYYDGDNAVLGRAAFNACPGDSGGPVINESTERAYGMLVSTTDGCGGDGRSNFMWISNFEFFSPYELAFAS
jgi:hypothetical protein